MIGPNVHLIVSGERIAGMEWPAALGLTWACIGTDWDRELQEREQAHSRAIAESPALFASVQTSLLMLLK